MIKDRPTAPMRPRPRRQASEATSGRQRPAPASRRPGPAAATTLSARPAWSTSRPAARTRWRLRHRRRPGRPQASPPTPEAAPEAPPPPFAAVPSPVFLVALSVPEVNYVSGQIYSYIIMLSDNLFNLLFLYCDAYCCDNLLFLYWAVLNGI